MKFDIEEHHLLEHPFYRSWEDGSLSKEGLREYAKDYFHHVSAFPRYLSRMHSRIENLEIRQILLENLIDEERGERNHPQLWLEFCEALGWSKEELLKSKPSEAINQLTSDFFGFAEKSAASALGALYAYESQIPEIAKFKIEALKKFYIEPELQSKLEFFEVHIKADEYHRAALEDVFSRMSETEKAEAAEAAKAAALSLWKFLDHMQSFEMAA